ncbi:MAG: ABC transporter permease [Flavobacteriales bacterium]|nr:ABC transporter permease [Flavobacteriales bacterium]
MNLSWFIAKRVSFAKDSKKNLSQIIVRIGQVAVTIGVVISLLSIATGFGAKKSIKEKLADFNGHAVLKSFDTNNSYSSSPLKEKGINFKELNNYNEVSNYQKFASKSGIIRTEKGFEGVVYKGYSNDFDIKRFQKFMVEGAIPDFSKKSYNDEVILSKKIASNLELKVGDDFVMYFISESNKPIYRKFTVKGIFKTDIKDIDENFIIGDLKHVQRLNKWKNGEIGGYEIFLKDIEHLDEIAPMLSKISGYENTIEKSTDTYVQIISWINLFDTNIYVILTIMFFVVVINLLLILLILIIERTQFIGIMKTLGTSNFKIQMIFVYNVLIIMIPGLIAGNAIALILLLIQKYYGIIRLNPENYFFEAVPVYLNPAYFILVSVFLILISMLALLIPSFIISKISPTKVLKFD